MTTTLSTAERKAAALEKLREGRALIEGIIADIKPDEWNKGSEWSATDAMRHMMGRPVYFRYVDQMLAEDNPDLGPRPTPDSMLNAMTGGVLRSIDEVIAFVDGLSVEQLERKGVRGGNETSVLTFVEIAAGHYLEHGNQIRNEILPKVRGQA